MDIFGYCVKCKAKNRKILNPTILKNTNGTYMVKGRCEVCGTTCCKIISARTKEELDQDSQSKNS